MAGKVLTALEKLVQNPKKVVVVCTLDGSEIDCWDDGASVTTDGVFPSGRRQALLNLLQKESRGYDNDKSKPKQRAYILKEKQAPFYNGDPVAAAPVLDDAWKKVIAKNVALRKEKLDASIPSLAAEVKKLTPPAKEATT